MKIEFSDEIYQRCAEYMEQNSDHMGVNTVAAFITSILKIAILENSAFANLISADRILKDMLTQCYNRKRFDNVLTDTIRQAQSLGQPFLTCKFCGVELLKLRD